MSRILQPKPSFSGVLFCKIILIITYIHSACFHYDNLNCCTLSMCYGVFPHLLTRFTVHRVFWRSRQDSDFHLIVPRESHCNNTNIRGLGNGSIMHGKLTRSHQLGSQIFSCGPPEPARISLAFRQHKIGELLVVLARIPTEHILRDKRGETAWMSGRTSNRFIFQAFGGRSQNGKSV